MKTYERPTKEKSRESEVELAKSCLEAEAFKTRKNPNGDYGGNFFPPLRQWEIRWKEVETRIAKLITDLGRKEEEEEEEELGLRGRKEEW